MTKLIVAYNKSANELKNGISFDISLSYHKFQINTGVAAKSLARPGRKQATATKF